MYLATTLFAPINDKYIKHKMLNLQLLSDIKWRLFIRAIWWDNARYGEQEIGHNRWAFAPILGFLLDIDISGLLKINHSDIGIYYRSIIHLENSKLIYFYETSNITYVTKRCRNTTYVYPVNNTVI